ncbi:MAG TPA: ATP-binding protein, partial [Saprospiraceae bacterium]|nr:ATP-binding protein [Saprospiraceae bacterium]
GIPPEMYEKVFYPRFTTKNSGMGLGLAMCKSIIDSIQGTITFKSELNMGTTFYISIPIFKHNPIH